MAWTAQAIERLRRAIDEYIHGLETTLEFGRWLDHDAFTSGRFDTGFVGQHFDAERFEAHRAHRRNQTNWSAASAILEKREPQRKWAGPTSAASAWRRRFED